MSALDQLPMWVVYDHPKDFPRNYVARRWEWNDVAQDYFATPELMVAPDVDMIRTELQKRGLVRLERHEDDGPKIMETWV